MSRFTYQVNKEIDEISKKARKGVANSVKKGYKLALRINPVDTGQSRSWWYISKSTGPYRRIERPRPSGHPRGKDIFGSDLSRSKSKATKVLKKYTMSADIPKIFIGNDISYMPYIDEDYGIYGKVNKRIHSALNKAMSKI